MGARETCGMFAAAENGDAKDLLRLLSSGADANARAGSGRSALMLASNKGHADCVERLLRVSDAKARDVGGVTALMLAAVNGHARCVGLLLPRSDAGAKDAAGVTALMFAAAGGHWECVEMLLPVSDVRAEDRRGRTAEDHARERRACGSLEVASLLERYGRSLAEREGLEGSLPVPEGSGKSHAARRRI